MKHNAKGRLLSVTINGHTFDCNTDTTLTIKNTNIMKFTLGQVFTLKGKKYVIVGVSEYLILYAKEVILDAIENSIDIAFRTPEGLTQDIQKEPKYLLSFHPLRPDTKLRDNIFGYKYSDLNIHAKINLKVLTKYVLSRNNSAASIIQSNKGPGTYFKNI